jgi:uncharacterized GH25 family protein
MAPASVVVVARQTGAGAVRCPGRRIGRRRVAWVVAFSTLCGPSLMAHDLWIEPGTFSPSTGEVIAVRLRVGQDFVGDPLPRDPALIKEFILDDGAGRRPVVGQAGRNPAGLVRILSPCLAIVGYHSHPSAVELTAEKFDQYLREEGLDAIAALRAQRRQTGPVREMFSRCAKSLILSGPSGITEGDHALGFTLELVAERNPYVLTTEQDLPVRVLYEGRPLPGVLVIAMNQADPDLKLTARSDREGRVTFRLPRGGVWLLKAVHMIPAPAGGSAEWQSFWASLTFALKGSDASQPAR